MRSWHLVHARTLVYAAAGIAALGIAGASVSDAASSSAALVVARQLFGLWALGFLLFSMIVGPLTSVVPWLPLKVHLIYARRAIGVSAFAFAVVHVLCYLPPVLYRSWRELYTPGVLWVAGLVISTLAFVDLAALAITSRDASVKRWGGRRWKQLHRSVYAALALVFLHAILNGSDFGLSRAPDVRGEADAGAFIGFGVAVAIWLIAFVLRRQRFIVGRPAFISRVATGR